MPQETTSEQRYQALIYAIATVAEIPDPDSLLDNCHLVVNNTAFTIANMSLIAADTGVLYADFGEVEHSQRDLVLQRLLESNLVTYSDRDAPSFAFNPESNHVVLLTRIDLLTASPEGVLIVMQELSEFAAVWRSTFLLSSEEARQ